MKDIIVSGFRKSLEINKAFSNLDKVLWCCLKGAIKSGIILFPASCGLGKSKAILDFLAEWKVAGFRDQESVLIVVGTIAEIKAYADRSRLDAADYAAFTSNEAVNRYGRGRGDADEARVLFTTQESFKRRTTNAGGFRDAAEFHYRGQPRRFIVWDETLCRAEPVSIRYDHLAAVPSLLRGVTPSLTARIDAFLPSKTEVHDGLLVKVPSDMVSAIEPAVRGYEAILSVPVRKALEGLGAAAGATLIARYQNYGGWYLVGACRALPHDLPPVVVVDASIGLRASYDVWRRSTDNVALLSSATADYSALKLHWWGRGCSKSTLAKHNDRHDVVSAVVDLINGRPNERWLIIYPKESEGIGGFSIPIDVRTVGLVKPENVQFLHWGRHTATNEYRDVGNIIVLGDHRYDEASYDAIYAAASGGQPSNEVALMALKLGEFAHNVYQAICRGNVRNIIDGTAGTANAYLITGRTQAKERALVKAFPGATLDDWQPITTRPLTKAQRLIVELERAFNQDGLHHIKISDLAIRCGGNQKGYLTREWSRDVIKAYLKHNGLIREGQSLRRSRAIQKLAA